MMDIEKLVQEQRRVFEAIERIVKNGTLGKFFAATEITPDDEKILPRDFDGIDPWDYARLKHQMGIAISEGIKNIDNECKRIKRAVNYLDTLYDSRVKSWEEYKQTGNAEWKEYITNPDCLKFFADYEKDHNIKDSIYQKSTGGKNVRG